MKRDSVAICFYMNIKSFGEAAPPILPPAGSPLTALAMAGKPKKR
jgi:hypothetical protein